MSNSESSEKESKKVEIKKIFINNVDKYQSEAICKMLNIYNTPDNDVIYEIYGSLYNIQETKLKHIKELVNDILYRESFDYFDDVLSCDVIIYDIGSDASQITEIETVLDTFLTLCKNVDNLATKYFILITTPLTWSKTKPMNDENIFHEINYRKRRAHPNYLKHKCIEREINLFEKKSNSKLRTIILCPGFTYGGSNDIFHYAFKLAFYNKDVIPIIRPGNNYIPVIHVQDFAMMIKETIDNFPEPENRYIFAAEPKSINLKMFIKKIVISVAGKPTKVKMIKKEQLLLYNKELFEQRVIDAITSNMNFGLTYFENFQFQFNGNDFGNTLAEQYRYERDLLPINILIDGPPCSGKTNLSKLLSQHYQLQIIDIRNILDYVIQILNQDIIEAKAYLDRLPIEKSMSINETQNDDEFNTFISEVQANLEKQIEEWTTELEEFQGYIRGNDEENFIWQKRSYIKILSSKMCANNQGYIIDGFPFTYSEASEIFLNKNDKENNETEEVATLIDLIPKHVILLDSTDEVLIKRAMAYQEQTAKLNERTEELMQFYLSKYKERNDEDKSLLTFFHDNNVIPINICSNEFSTPSGIFEMVKQEIGSPHIYPLSKEQLILLQKIEKEKHDKELKEINRIRDELKAKIKSEREVNLKKWSKEFERLKHEEEAYLEAQTLPLRHYLSKFVLPTLTEGILKVAELKPEDPVDFLAEYFFKCNSSGHILSSNYYDELKNLLIDDGKDDSLGILNTLADNVSEFNCN